MMITTKEAIKAMETLRDYCVSRNCYVNCELKETCDWQFATPPDSWKLVDETKWGAE